LHFGGLLVEEREGRCPVQASQVGKSRFDGGVAVAWYDPEVRQPVGARGLEGLVEFPLCFPSSSAWPPATLYESAASGSRLRRSDTTPEMLPLPKQLSETDMQRMLNSVDERMSHELVE
jgi:hypothetical protein